MAPTWSDVLPPPIEQPNVYPIEWHTDTPKFWEIYENAKRQNWDPAALPWEGLKACDFSAEERLGLIYWFSLLNCFDASAPPVFAKGLIAAYEAHEEDPLRKCFFTIVRDEVNHEEFSQRNLATFIPGASLYRCDPLGWEPRTELEAVAQRNVRWVYSNGARYWKGYLQAYEKYSLPVLFSSFFMGEVGATTLFHQMCRRAEHPVWKEGFRNIGRDDARHMAMTFNLLKRVMPQLTDEEKPLITRQLRAGFVFLSMILYEPPGQFWDLPHDFLDSHRELIALARRAGLGIARVEKQREIWRDAMLKVKGVVEPHGIAFPAMPEVGLSGVEVVEDTTEGMLVPVF